MVIYETFYSLLQQYIFGTIESGSYQELVAILASTIGCLFVVALPFIVVWKIIRMILGAFGG